MGEDLDLSPNFVICNLKEVTVSVCCQFPSLLGCQ